MTIRGSATSQQSVQDARKKLTKFLRTIETVPSQILEEEAARIRAEAKRKTPYKTGRLEKNVYVRVSKDKRRPGLVAGASARNNGVQYAGIQHEATWFNHPIKGQAHYISEPFEEGTRRIKRRLKREVRMPK